MATDDIELAVKKGMQPFVDELKAHKQDDIETDKLNQGKFEKGEKQFKILHEGIKDIQLTLRGTDYSSGMVSDLKSVMKVYRIYKAAALFGAIATFLMAAWKFLGK